MGFIQPNPERPPWRTSPPRGSGTPADAAAPWEVFTPSWCDRDNMGGTLGKVRRSQCVQEAVAVTSFWDGDPGRPCREGEEGWRGPQGGQTAATFPDRLGLLTRPPEAATPSQGLSAYSTSTVTATLVISSECLEQKKGRDCVIPSLEIGKGGSSDSPHSARKKHCGPRSLGSHCPAVTRPTEPGPGMDPHPSPTEARA